MSMDECVSNVDEGDQQPYGERDKEIDLGSKVGELLLQSSARDQLNW